MYGIVVAKDVMIPMRDGIRLATDIHRPARDGELVEGQFPTIVCITPYDKSERRYVEIADFFVPHGYVVVLQDMRDRHRSEGTKEYFHVVTPHTGEDGYDTIEWIAAQRWSNGRTGMVGSSYAGINQVRTALERPPHLRVDDLAAIQRAVTTPIATGERLVGLNAFHELLSHGGCSVVQPDLTHCGGLSEARRIATLAEVHRVALAPHNPQGPVSTAASVELGLATPAYVICEAVTEDVPWRADVAQDSHPVDDDGMLVRASDAPGLGIEVDLDEVARHPFEQELPQRVFYRDGSVGDW
jgi:hypothetical protein